ncbi:MULTISPECIES: fimbrial protein [unclassified Pseudomonas]|uniref:fimbrial protein n=1 Tax=unclassified Pseudomonas TaxID=196821 RepID=UPI0014031BF5|nr:MULTISPECIES: fimbrial protein [unclassified Pseudomonas]
MFKPSRQYAFSGALSAAASLLASPCAQAACSYMYGTSQTTYELNLPSTLNVGLAVPVGGTVYEVTRSLPILNGAARWGRCAIGDAMGITNNVGAPGSGNRYPIGNTGLAWTWEYTGTTGVGSYNYNPFGPYPYFTIPSRATEYHFEQPSVFRIIKISNNVSGTIPSGIIGTLTAGGLTPIVWRNGSGSINIVQPTCRTPSKLVQLGEHSIGEFKGVGSGTKAQRFTIDLNNCPAGMAGISYRLDPVGTVLSAANGVMALNAGGASGVGLQILRDNGTVLPLSSSISYLRNPASGNYSIALQARYYQTSKNITPGAANASVQFTITYN